MDAAERNSLAPKQFEQLNTTIKMSWRHQYEFPARLAALVLKYKGLDRMVDVMKDVRAPGFRIMLGLPEIAGR